MTESGKTFAGRTIARKWKDNNWETLVLHKPKEPWGRDEVTIQTTNLDLFLNAIEERNDENHRKHLDLGIPEYQLKGYIAFIEIADGDVEKNDTRVHKLFSQERHNAHKFHYLSQRRQSAHPSIRENCSSLMLFLCHLEQAEVWAKEFNDPILKKAASIPPHWFFFKRNKYSPAIYTKL